MAADLDRAKAHLGSSGPGWPAPIAPAGTGPQAEDWLGRAQTRVDAVDTLENESSTQTRVALAEGEVRALARFVAHALRAEWVKASTPNSPATGAPPPSQPCARTTRRPSASSTLEREPPQAIYAADVVDLDAGRPPTAPMPSRTRNGTLPTS